MAKIGRNPKFAIGTTVMFANAPFNRKRNIVGSVGEVMEFENGKYKVYDGDTKWCVTTTELEAL